MPMTVEVETTIELSPSPCGCGPAMSPSPCGCGPAMSPSPCGCGPALHSADPTPLFS